VLGLHATQPVHNEQQLTEQRAAAPSSDGLSKLEDALSQLGKLEKENGYASSHYKIGAFLDEHALLIGILLAAISGCSYGTKLYHQRVQEIKGEKRETHDPSCTIFTSPPDQIHMCNCPYDYMGQMNRDAQRDWKYIKRFFLMFVLTMITSDISAHVLGKKLKAMAEHKPYTILQSLRRTLIEAWLHHPYLIGCILEVLLFVKFSAFTKTRSVTSSIIAGAITGTIGLLIGACTDSEVRSEVKKWLDSKEHQENARC